MEPSLDTIEKNEAQYTVYISYEEIKQISLWNPTPSWQLCGKCSGCQCVEGGVEI